MILKKSEGVIDKRDSCYPTVVKLDNGVLIAGYAVGGGPKALGGTEWSWSDNEGRDWNYGGIILPPDPETGATNTLRLSRTVDERMLAYGERRYRQPGQRFGQIKNEIVLCYSDNKCRTWSEPKVVSSTYRGNWEASSPILVLHDGTFLAPGATLPSEDRLGEQVLVMRSEDNGQTWPDTYVAMKDPKGELGFFEQKLIEMELGQVMMMAWTVTLGDYHDTQNHFTISNDGGKTWSNPQPTGIYGQTMTPLYLGKNRFLILYNKRYGDRGIRMCLAKIKDGQFLVDYDDFIYNSGSSRKRPIGTYSGVDELAYLNFGLPSAINLEGNDFLAVFWCKESEMPFECRWARLKINN